MNCHGKLQSRHPGRQSDPRPRAALHPQRHGRVGHRPGGERSREARRPMGRRNDVRRYHAVGPHGRNRQRVSEQGLARADRRPAEARPLGERRPEASKLKVVGERMQMLGGREGGGGAPAVAAAAAADAAPTRASERSTTIRYTCRPAARRRATTFRSKCLVSVAESALHPAPITDIRHLAN